MLFLLIWTKIKHDIAVIIHAILDIIAWWPFTIGHPASNKEKADILIKLRSHQVIKRLNSTMNISEVNVAERTLPRGT